MMKLTPHGCLSRSVAGIRGKTLIINLPGSEKAAKENILATLAAVRHGVQMLQSSGSMDCAAQQIPQTAEKAPSLDVWLREAKADKNAGQCGMYLFHNGIVRQTAKAQVRMNKECAPVAQMEFSYDTEKVSDAIENAKQLPGVHYIRVWLNKGRLNVGDDIMLVLVGGDIRPHVIDALQALVGEIKTNCVTETEVF